MENIKENRIKPKRTLERYVDLDGKIMIRIKYQDKYHTEVIMTEEEFNRVKKN